MQKPQISQNQQMSYFSPLCQLQFSISQNTCSLFCWSVLHVQGTVWSQKFLMGYIYFGGSHCVLTSGGGGYQEIWYDQNSPVDQNKRFSLTWETLCIHSSVAKQIFIGGPLYSGVTGGGLQSTPSDTCHREISADLPERERQGKKGEIKIEKGRWKLEKRRGKS